MSREQEVPDTPDGTADGADAVVRGEAPPMETDDGSGLVFRSLEAFYTDYLSVVVRRRVDGTHLAWCPDWWTHPEAIARLASLWRAFEYLRTDESFGLSNWWLHHADPHLAALMDPRTGPFALCAGPGGHSDGIGPLPSNPVPPGLLHDPAFSLDAAEEAEAAAADAEGRARAT
ncbi:DUF4913 domain-containing protein [Streptomyces sp. NPDC001515]